jgi:hypothetical protein
MSHFDTGKKMLWDHRASQCRNLSQNVASEKRFWSIEAG